MLFALAGMAIGAGLNYLSSQEEQANIDKQRKILGETIISPGERSRMERDLDRTFNSNISTSMNSMALKTRGTDASMATAAALGQAEGSRIEAKSGLYSSIASINRGIRTQIAGVQDANIAGSVISGGIEGGIAGAQITNLLATPDTPEVAPQTPGIDIAPSTGIVGMDKFDQSVGPESLGFSVARTIAGIKTPTSSIQDNIYKGPIQNSPDYIENRPEDYELAIEDPATAFKTSLNGQSTPGVNLKRIPTGTIFTDIYRDTGTGPSDRTSIWGADVINGIFQGAINVINRSPYVGKTIDINSKKEDVLKPLPRFLREYN